MDHALGGTQQEFQVVHEPKPGSALGVEVVVRGGNDHRSRSARHESLQPGERGVRVSRCVEWLDAMPGPHVTLAGDASREEGAGRKPA